MTTPAGDEPELTGRVSLDLSRLVSGLRFAQAVTRRQISRLVESANDRLGGLDTSRLAAGIGRVVSTVGSIGGRLAVPFAAAGAAIGGAVPIVAGLVATLAQIAPAAAVGVSAMMAIQLASGAVRLAMVGMDEAIGAALDPSKAAEFNKALEKLSPNARAFAQQVRTLAPQLRSLQQAVQDRFFRGLDDTLKTTATATLPVLRRGLLDAADSTRAMAKGMATAATDMAQSGTLGKAVDGATRGLDNMRRIPGQITAGLIQIGAAAAPAFNRLTSGAAGFADRISQKLTAAFESGAMERAIDQALDLLSQLGTIAGNVFSVVRSIFSAAQAEGGGFLGVLEQITGAMAAAFASPQVQAGLRALFGVMAQLAQAAGPLLASVLGTIAGIMVQLGPPIQLLIEHLGAGLLKIFEALGPVLVTAAGALGELIVAALPLIDVAAQLISALLPALVPLFEALSQIFQAAAPFVAQLAKNLAALLMPIFETLATEVLPKILPPFVRLAETLFPLLTEVLIELAPGLTAMGQGFAKILEAVTPLIVGVLDLVSALVEDLAPILRPIMLGLSMLVSGGLETVWHVITNYVIPALKTMAALMRGDWSAAMGHAKTLSENTSRDVGGHWQRLKHGIYPALQDLANGVASRVYAMGSSMIRATQDALGRVIGVFQSIPGRIQGALSGAAGMLYGIGQSIVRGLINGISSMIPSLSGTLGGITDKLPDWKGPAERDATILAPSGRLLIEGLQAGIAAQLPALRAQLQSITASVPSMAASAVAGPAAPLAGGDTHYTFNLSGGDASPDGILRALSWRGLVGGTHG
jgi:phage-related protein